MKKRRPKINIFEDEEILFESANKKGKYTKAKKAADFKGSIKKLLRYLKPFYLPLSLSILCIGIATTISILAPGKLSDLTNILETAMIDFSVRYQTEGSAKIHVDMDAIARLGFILIAMYSSNAILSFLQSYTMAGIVQNLSKKLRNEISNKINRIPLKYFDSKPFGDTLSRVTNDVDTISQSLSSAISSLISSVLMLIGVLIAMFLACWQLTLTSLTVVPLSFLLMYMVMKISQKYFVRQQRYLGAVNGTVEEVFSGQSIVKVFNAQERTEEAFINYNKKLRKCAYLSQALSSMMHPFMTFVSKLGFVAVCVVGAILYTRGDITLGTMVAFFLYVNMFQQPLGQLGQITNTLQSAAAASERVFEFLEEEEQTEESNKEFQLPASDVKGKVEFRNVKFGYLPDKMIINNFNAIIQPGQKVAIVGPTGAGKTTLVNLLMRFYDLIDGDILIDDISIRDLTRENLRDLFSMVLQDTWLFEGTIAENIIYSKQEVSQQMLEQAAQAANIDHYIKGLPDGYESLLSTESDISGGQKQLITIARAMLQNSPMMILDEATSNVDTRTEELIQEAMDHLTHGRTSFVIAHRLSTIRNADVILVMKDGDIIEQGNHDELLKQHGFYANLYHSQFSGTSEEMTA